MDTWIISWFYLDRYEQGNVHEQQEFYSLYHQEVEECEQHHPSSTPSFQFHLFHEIDQLHHCFNQTQTDSH